jgi:hypothetical protein
VKSTHLCDHADTVRAAAPHWPTNRVNWVAAQAVKDAIEIATDVRCHDPELVFGDVSLRARDDLPRLVAAVVALAAMVPVDHTVSDLLAWTEDLAQEAS